MAFVLVADDDPDIRELVIFKLKQAGHEAVGVADGPAAVNLALEIVPDVAIVDVTMPGLSGLGVCAALRENEATAGIPVVLLSARARPGDQQRGLHAGAAAYVTKPFSPRELIARVESLLAAG